jgi:probable rRNA maturation factor
VSRILIASRVPSSLSTVWFTKLDSVLKKRFKIRRRISIAFVSESEMQRLNRRYRKKNKPTDVLSFSLDEKFGTNVSGLAIKPEGFDFLGEIVICLAKMKRQARVNRQSISEEFKKLVIHGCLHLLGFDHQKAKEAIMMERLEEQMVRKINQ